MNIKRRCFTSAIFSRPEFKHYPKTRRRGSEVLDKPYNEYIQAYNEWNNAEEDLEYFLGL